MTTSQHAALEQVARGLRHELTQQDRDWDCCLSNEQASVELIVKALAAQRAAGLEEAVHIQCLKCAFTDQYSPAVVEVGQWMHQHILSKTWTLCDAERILKYKKDQGVLTP